MKKITFTLLFIALLLVGAAEAFSQNPLVDKEGVVTFFSEAPLEDIDAINEKAFGAMDMEKGTLAVSIKINQFEFDKSLMQEHFNENYMESEKYPTSTFTGTIKNYNAVDLSKKGTTDVEVAGEIEIHGIKKPFEATVKFNNTGKNLSANTTFNVQLEDFEVKIPRMLFKNIAETVEVKAKFNFTL